MRGKTGNSGDEKETWGARREIFKKNSQRQTIRESEREQLKKQQSYHIHLKVLLSNAKPQVQNSQGKLIMCFS
jgi:hypothetical protein